MATSGSAMNVPPSPTAVSMRKTFSWGALRAFVQLTCSFISIKFTAIYLGPSGLALIAQFGNFMMLCQGVVSSGLDTATARLSAEYGSDSQRRKALLGTVGKIALVVGLTTAAVVAIASAQLASWLLTDRAYSWVFMAATLSIVAAILNNVLLSALSARGEIGRLILSNVFATIIALLIFAPACVYWGVIGGLLASAVVYPCQLIVTVAFVHSSLSVRARDFVGPFVREEAVRIANFYPMLIVHSVAGPLSLILIRQHVSSSLSLESAGIWQACVRISETYGMIITSIVTTQFMARLGATIRDPDRLRAEVLKTLSLSLGVTVAFALGIFLLREWVVRLIFAPAFLPVIGVLPMQLVGDVFKMAGVTLGFALVATLRSRWYIAIALVTPIVFVGVSRVLAEPFGVHGVTTAHAVAGLTQLSLAVIALRDVIFRRRGRR
jgi:PST family polysaccharide transporter